MSNMGHILGPISHTKAMFRQRMPQQHNPIPRNLLSPFRFRDTTAASTRCAAKKTLERNPESSMQLLT